MKTDRINYVIVGSFVLAMLVGLVVAVALLTGRTGATDAYHVMYRNVTGIKFGTQVLFEGFPIGQVEEIIPEPRKGGMRFRVEVGVIAGWQIPEDSVAQIAAAGLLAAVSININAGPSQKALEPGGEIRGKEAANIFAAMSSVAGEISELNESHIKPLLADLTKATRAFSALIEKDAQVALKRFADLAGDIAKRTPGIIAGIESFTANMDQSSEQLALLMAPENRQKVEAAVENINQATAQLRLFLRPENRQKLESITENIESTSAELRLQPRKPSSYEKLHVLVNPETGDLLKTTVFFVLGNVTEVAFSNIELNVNPAASLFRLDPPADVRVIELDEPAR